MYHLLIILTAMLESVILDLIIIAATLLLCLCLERRITNSSAKSAESAVSPLESASSSAITGISNLSGGLSDAEEAA